VSTIGEVNFTRDYWDGHGRALNDAFKRLLLDYTDGTSADWSTNDLKLKFINELFVLTGHPAPSGSVNDQMRAALLLYLNVPDVGQTIDDLWGAITGPFVDPVP
jgi:hypothetical protein